MSLKPRKSGPELLLTMLQNAHNFPYEDGDIVFTDPFPANSGGRNTGFTATFSTGPLAGQTKTFYYNRLDLGLMLNPLNPQLQDNGNLGTDSQHLVTHLNNRFDLTLSSVDLESVPMNIVTYPHTQTVRAAPESLVLTGEVDIEIIEPLEYNAPVGTTTAHNANLSAMFLNGDGQLLFDDTSPNGNFSIARANGIEIGIRAFAVGGAPIPSVDGLFDLSALVTDAAGDWYMDIAIGLEPTTDELLLLRGLNGSSYRYLRFFIDFELVNDPGTTASAFFGGQPTYYMLMNAFPADPITSAEFVQEEAETFRQTQAQFRVRGNEIYTWLVDNGFVVSNANAPLGDIRIKFRADDNEERIPVAQQVITIKTGPHVP